MLNQIVIVGRLTSEPKIKEVENKKVGYITLAVPRSYKNMNGEYDTDFIDCILWNVIAENTAEYCKKGDLVGIKGRLQTTINEDQTKTNEVIVERLTFLSSNKKEN